MRKLQSAIARMTVASLCSISLGAAAAYPEQTINYIIPFGPGGESDIAARLQEPLFKKLGGQPVAIQYKAGAGGAAAWAQLNSMTADGYTMMGTNLPHIVLQPMEKDVGYRTADMTNVYWFHYTPDALLVTADSPYKTLADYLAAARKAPGGVIVGGTGTNSGNELAKARLDKLAGIKTTYIPFKGTGAVNTALLGKQVAASWGYTTVKLQLGDQVRCLAVAMEARHPRMPDCPTFRELGIDMVGGVYRGLAVPSNTPAAVQKQVAGLIGQINKDPAFVEKMLDNGFTVVDVGPEQMKDFMDKMNKEYAEAAKDLGIKAK
ncbi:MAG: tripartite tricarboxylate transporter substrate binding protein [Azoarcus sp.]|jgi:tripartite-type tricarboxylate transporter receptor subunit TctC|nr:tripartite tricarboxylate transporter substrate binding protein [Azoarcus sp.]MDD2873801.1 tripartite tricarboxylate transporter substrate binding protein [Azoarcus sp.]MDX9838074.1 tripartite tricarboxylate transporter substrate binding protein [Azoarcus sp.]